MNNYIELLNTLLPVHFTVLCFVLFSFLFRKGIREGKKVLHEEKVDKYVSRGSLTKR